MSRYIAFLRGINVGGHRVTMDVLKELFTHVGLDDVSTFLASGNVAFSTDRSDVAALSREIEGHLDAGLDFGVPVVLRSLEEAQRAGAFEHGVPQRGDAERSHYVILFAEPPSKEVREALSALESEYDTFVLADRDVHWVLQGKMSESPLFGRGIDHALKGVVHTTRNVNTLRRMAKREGAKGAT